MPGHIHIWGTHRQTHSGGYRFAPKELPTLIVTKVKVEELDQLFTLHCTVGLAEKKKTFCIILPQMYLAVKLNFRNILLFELFDPRSF